ncbi:2,4-dienoyl-CoA reductase [Clavulina sp. PMI_390]|nr:2,4-dienoyl-CoA reductase [Clavulina sp. PMI_390]
MRHGGKAFIVGRKLDKLAQAAKELSSATGGQSCSYASADVRDKDALKKAVEKCVQEFGRIDFVICGAAGNFLSPISGVSENAFRTVLEIDTLGTYNTIKATLPHIRESRGAYIHVSATLHYRGLPYQVHVSAAKAAVDALSNVLAVEEGPRGVRSNVIAPGPIADTAGFDRLSTSSDQKQSVQSRFPLGRYGSTKDIQNATVFLFSEAANWVTGQIIAVDGGELHTSQGMVPNYPQNVLDPESMKHLVPRL